MKRLFSAILTAAMFSILVFTLPAAAATASASLSGSGTIRSGDTITVNFNINGSGVEGVQGTIQYDGGQLTLTGTSQKISSAWEVDFSGKNFVAYDKNQNSPINGSKAMFSMTFKVNAGLSTGTPVKVSVTGGKASGGSGDIELGSPEYSASLAAPLSTNTNLASLNVSNATISPAFNKNTTSYTASVPFSVDKLNISATPEDAAAKVSVSSPVLTPNGTTAVNVTVTAQNGTKKTYTIKVSRAQDPNYKPGADNNLREITVNPCMISPAFSKDVTKYVVWLPNEVTGITVNGTAEDSKATVAVSGGKGLIAGKDNVITVVCTAENGSKKTYTIIAKRATPDGLFSVSATSQASLSSSAVTTNSKNSASTMPIWLGIMLCIVFAGIGFAISFIILQRKI